MKKFIQSLLLTCYYYGVGLIYCSILSIMMVVDTMRFGTAVWKEKNRKKNSSPSNNKIWTPPERRDDPEITWKHGYVQTEDLRFHFVASGEIPSHLKINEIDGETTLLKQGMGRLLCKFHSKVYCKFLIWICASKLFFYMFDYVSKIFLVCIEKDKSCFAIWIIVYCKLLYVHFKVFNC